MKSLPPTIPARYYGRWRFWLPLCRGVLKLWRLEFQPEHESGWRDILACEPAEEGQLAFADTLCAELARIKEYTPANEYLAVWLPMQLALSLRPDARAAAALAMTKLLAKEEVNRG